VRRIISTGKTHGIIKKDTGELVAWCLLYDYGGLAMLQTREVNLFHFPFPSFLFYDSVVSLKAYRGQGIGKIIVKSFLSKLFQEFSFSAPPFGFIETDNESSLKLFQSLGFQKTMDILWVGLNFWENR
jgi:GNAT superfamily N-acetyltransferase